MVVIYVEIEAKRGRDRSDVVEELLAHGSYGMHEKHQALIAVAGMG